MTGFHDTMNNEDPYNYDIDSCSYDIDNPGVIADKPTTRCRWQHLWSQTSLKTLMLQWLIYYCKVFALFGEKYFMSETGFLYN